MNMQSVGARSFRTALALFMVLVLGFSFALARTGSNKKDKLPKFYSEWLERDVAYIITKQEQKDFLALTTDEQRDDFIKRFWDIRNPTPGSPVNTYKDELYRRIAYADAHFGIGSGEEGWRTDRGRTYITLGAPQQIQKHYGAPNLRPMEIWFYSNLNPALPPFFYVAFFQPDSMGDFQYYSPRIDGPDKLVTGTEAINNPKAALKMIQSSVGSEVARVAQTLIPGEPLDPDGRVSMQSDIMLSTLKSLANQPSNVDDINRRRQTLETVTSRMILDSKNLDIVLFPVRDAHGLTWLNYAVRLGSASDLTLKKEDGRYSYNVEVRVQVHTEDNSKLILTQQKSVADYLTQQQVDEIKHRPFGYEGILALAPGKYHLDFLVTDWTQKLGFHAERDVAIPESSADTFAIPAVLPFSGTEPADPLKEEVTPFAIAGIRFKPLGQAAIVLNHTQDLQVAYQVWATRKNPQSGEPDLSVQYTLGKPAVAGSATVIKDTISMDAFNASGSVLSGKKISLADLSAGNYIFTISVSHPGTPHKTYAQLSFQLLDDAPGNLPWDVDEPGAEDDRAKGVYDQQRALTYLADGHPDDARMWFRLALSKDHRDDIARSRLVDAYYTLNAYSAVVSLFNDAGVTGKTDSGTIVQIAESFLKTGDAPKSVSILEDAIRARPEDGPLYLALADSYQQMGKPQEAMEMSRKGKSLLGNNPTPATTPDK